MESVVPESNPNQSEQCQNMNKTESAENFQKFIYELFDKNGILNDLRAYLRGHIVNVLKNAHVEEPSSCQRHFTQRLECTFQAINMLIAEYLLCLEFNYSLSVFVSEIPLANMVFGFAKSLMDLGVDGNATGLRFRENDVWSIINVLGIKCDAEHVNKIVEMYKTETKSPLLLCILKCVQPLDVEQLHSGSSQESSIASSKSSDSKHHGSPTQCKHYAFCKACRRRYRRQKDKYREKKKHYNQSVRAVNAHSMESFMKSIGVLERNLTNEVFDELKTVYEAELDMIKKEHEGKIKNSLASHVQHFQRMKNELEESFKSREAALEASIVHKKRFLWGLAQALRAQHSQMTKAMQAVKRQTAELADQEQNIKSQRTEVEESLKKQAEGMRQQIADELIILERHLDSMKTERESLSREKCYLDLNEAKLTNTEVKNYLQTHYNLLKDELGGLKMCIENATFQPKRLIERWTITEDLVCIGMNNEVRVVREEVRPKQVVNDLKKQKNVNFSQCKPIGESSASSSGSSTSEDLNIPRFAKQNQRVVSPLRLQPEPSPRMTPTVPRVEHSMRESIQGSGWHKGAGEERGLFASAQILVPGDTLPFVGVISDRRGPRRHLLNRWRALRRRVSPQGGPELTSVTQEKPVESAAKPELNPSSEHFEPTRNTKKVKQQKDMVTPSPASVTLASRDKTPPSAMLREAKLRLRKLEIEAEAVARSYNDFRRRAETKHPDFVDQQSSTPYAATKLETRKEEILHYSKPQARLSNSYNFDMDKYLRKYQFNLDTRQNNLLNINTNTINKTIPKSYSDEIRHIEPVPKDNYLEKPIHEFRKLYYPNPIRIRTPGPISRSFQEPSRSDMRSEKDLVKLSQIEDDKNNPLKELEVLKQNMLLHEEPTKETIEISKEVEEISGNLLTVEVENMSEVNNVKDVSTKTDVTVIVEGSVDSKAIIKSKHEDSKDVKMTITVSPTQIDESTDTNDRLSEKSDSSLPLVNTSIKNDDKEIYETENDKELPNNDIEVEIHKEPDSEQNLEVQMAVSDTDKATDDYQDDFSFDVDNYKSEDENSPISFAKTSEDENFWD